MLFPHLEMLKDIDELVETDFAFDMECKRISRSKPYTQKEAKKMSELIGEIYLISHAIYCETCGAKYFSPEAFKSQKKDLEIT